MNQSEGLLYGNIGLKGFNIYIVKLWNPKVAWFFRYFSHWMSQKPILPMKGTLFDFFVHILITKMWSYSVFLPEHDMWLHDRKQLMPICRLLIIRYDFKGHQTVEGSNSANSADHSTTSCLFFHSFNTHFLPASLPLPAGGIKAHYLPTGRKDDKSWSHCVTMTSDFTRSPTSSC